MSADERIDPAYAIQPPPETVALWLSRAKQERNVAVQRLDGLERTAQGVRHAIVVWEGRIKMLEDMSRPDIWTDAIEAQLHVPPPRNTP